MQPFMIINILILCVVFVILTLESVTGGTGVWRTVSLCLTALAVLLWIAGRIVRHKDRRRERNETSNRPDPKN